MFVECVPPHTEKCDQNWLNSATVLKIQLATSNNTHVDCNGTIPTLRSLTGQDASILFFLIVQQFVLHLKRNTGPFGISSSQILMRTKPTHNTEIIVDGDRATNSPVVQTCSQWPAINDWWLKTFILSVLSGGYWPRSSQTPHVGVTWVCGGGVQWPRNWGVGRCGEVDGPLFSLHSSKLASLGSPHGILPSMQAVRVSLTSQPGTRKTRNSQ